MVRSSCTGRCACFLCWFSGGKGVGWGPQDERGEEEELGIKERGRERERGRKEERGEDGGREGEREERER